MNHRAILLLILLIVGLSAAFPSIGLSQEEESPSQADALREAFRTTTGAPWTIDAATISYDFEKRVYEAEGNVRILSEDRAIQADHAILDTQKQQVELRGNVFLRYGKNWLRGEHVIWNLNHETGWVNGGLLYFSENNFYAQGRSISKIGPNTYELKEGVLTSCDPANPDWSVRYGEMNVNVEGTAWIKDTSFRIRGIPVLYSPIVALPIQQKRQTGFLVPWAGFSDLNGFETEVPFYWAFREDMDATFYGRYMERRGWMSGVEYRIAHKLWGEGIWMAHYLRDTASPGDLRAQGFSFEDDDRYWLRARHALDLPYDFKARLDLDVVSDRNFLQEFNRGSSSYNFTNKMFLEYTGRGFLFDATSPIRESALLVDKATESSLLSFDARYWQNLQDLPDGTPLEDFTLQRVPAVSYDVIASPVGESPFYYTLDSSAINYWRREGDRGSRLSVHPRIHAPLHWKNFLDVEPSLGLRGSGYAVDWERVSRGAIQGQLLADFHLEMSTQLNRVYDWQFGDTVAVQHSIRPEIFYEAVPDGIEGRLPVFDRLDVDAPRHGIAYGVSNFLMAKEVRNDAQGNSVTSFRELARLRLFQEYNFEVPEESRIFGRPTDEGFSAVGMRVDITPRRYVTLSYDTDLYTSGSTPAFHDLFVTLESGRGDVLRVDYQFRNDIPVNELITEFLVKVSPNLYLNTYHDYSLQQDKIFRQGYGFRYLHGCWGIGVAYEKEADDDRIAVSIDLLGLGTFGSRMFSGATGSGPALGAP